jgi:hypothetical protein
MAHKTVYIRIILEELGHVNLPHHYKLIMQWQTVSSMVKNNQNKQSHGHEIPMAVIGNANDNSAYTGNPES